ncbi:MAG: hypothetical protein MUF56_03180 [Solirubrobacteraceae bacterium]|nr:hypothetical protein [Solirubrobacteraceae bacterium]
MAPRQINTMHEPVACAVCQRTLLRGETPSVFLHAGERRMVCELCVPRAVHEGWIREGADQAPGRATRGWSRGGGRSLMGRLRGRRDREAELLVPEEAEALLEALEAEPLPEPEPVPAPPPPASEYEVPAAPPMYREDRFVHAIPTNADMKVVRAIELFNASQHRRTVAGVARTLGAPLVSVRPSPTEGSIVTIVVAWELSWYRYEIDLADEAAGVRHTGQGAELEELEEPDRAPNAIADETGELHAAVQPA